MRMAGCQGSSRKGVQGTERRGEESDMGWPLAVASSRNGVLLELTRGLLGMGKKFLPSNDGVFLYSNQSNGFTA